MTLLDESGGSPTTVIPIAGDVDIRNAIEVREKLLAALVSDAPALVLDLTGLRFVDSTGIGIIAGACRRAQATGKAIDVVGLPPRIARVFATAGVDALLASVASHREAFSPEVAR